MISYPKQRDENLDYRARTIDRANNDEVFRGAVYQAVSDNILYWINTFLWVYEPRSEQQGYFGASSPHLPFITFEYQDEYIFDLVNAINKGEDLLTEKSRDMGVSWTVIAVLLYMWQFGGGGNDFLVGSRKEEYVDKQGVMDALFPKARYLLSRQPEWMWPVGFDFSKHDTYMRMINPHTGSYIKGESNNKNFGTSGRYKAAFLDEFAKWEHTDAMAWQSLSDATPCRLPVSSAFGRNNQFYKLRAGQVGNIKIKRLHYKLHPQKDSDWYESEKKRRSPQDLAAEVDIDYQASIVGRAFSSFNYNTHCAEPYPEYNTNLPLDLYCDFNITPMSWSIGHEVKGDDWFVDEMVDYQRTNTHDHIAEFCIRYKDHQNKTIYVYGDATGKYGSTKSNRSDYKIIQDELKKKGWHVSICTENRNPPIPASLQASNKRFSDWEKGGVSHVRVNPEKCPALVASFEGTQRKGDNIDKKDGVEHSSDGPRYKWNYKYPINKGFVGAFKR